MYKNFINRGRHALSALQPAIKPIMRIGLLYLIITITCAQLLLANSSGAQSLAEIQVSVELRNEEVRNLLKQIEKQTALRFAYMENQLSRKEKFNLPKGRYRVSEALNVTLPALNLTYMNTGNGVYIMRKQPDQKDGRSSQAGASEYTGAALAAPVQLTVKGKVADEKGEGLPGVNIILKGTQQGQISDVDGRFSIEVPDENAVLVFSFVGYVPQEVAVGKKTEVEVLLKVDQKALDEVVVVGYGTQQRRNISGSIATAPTELVANRPVMNVG
ncbi:carboxypeptidase-like regulatory domain-containing protein, partial [Dyadobacter sp.]|uniref:carboxypeptidase-like regulatory domain-containing protein n=1 Tax=Dyadobacter sp. TaxID=1914288 RepID=UPI003F6EBF95